MTTTQIIDDVQKFRRRLMESATKPVGRNIYMAREVTAEELNETLCLLLAVLERIDAVEAELRGMQP